MYRLACCDLCNKTYCSERKLKRSCHPAQRRLILFCFCGFGFVIGDGRKSYLAGPHINHSGQLSSFTPDEIISIIDFVYRNDSGSGCTTVLEDLLQNAAGGNSSVLSRAADNALAQPFVPINSQLLSPGEFHYVIRSPNVVDDAISTRGRDADGVGGVQHMVDANSEQGNFNQDAAISLDSIVAALESDCLELDLLPNVCQFIPPASSSANNIVEAQTEELSDLVNEDAVAMDVVDDALFHVEGGGEDENEFMIVDAVYNCVICRESFSQLSDLIQHSALSTIADHYQSHQIYNEQSGRFLLCRAAMRGMVRDYQICAQGAPVDVNIWLNYQELTLKTLLDSLFTVYNLNVRINLVCEFRKYTTNSDDGENIQISDPKFIYFWSRSTVAYFDFDSWYAEQIAYILNKIDNFQEHDSGLEFQRVSCLNIKCTLSQNIRGGSRTVKLPLNIARKKAVVNVDAPAECFKWAMLAALHSDEVNLNRQRASKYKRWENDIVFGGTDGIDENCVGLKDIPKLESINNIKINVHLYDNGRLKGPVYNSRKTDYPRVVNLLLLNTQLSWHYCAIISLTRLYRGITSTKAAHSFMCDRCCRTFWLETSFTSHRKWCLLGKPQIEKMPANKEYAYKTSSYELKPLKVIYADVECFIGAQKIHYPSTIACRTVWHEYYRGKEAVEDVKIWEGQDCIKEFLTYIETVVEEQDKQYEVLTRRNIRMTPEDNVKYNDTNRCQQCNISFVREGEVGAENNNNNSSAEVRKVRDHCHITGVYREALCSKCNFLRKQKRRMLPIIFHNFKNYDCHILLKRGISEMSAWELSCIAQTKEKFMNLRANIPIGQTKTGQTRYFTVNFIDSYQFLPSSLAKLVGNLDNLPIAKRMLNKYQNCTMATLKRKGVFPYAYFDSLAKLNETSLPSIENFKNDLTGEECSANDYEHAQNAWSQFNCSTLGDYLKIYLELDVNLLADVFQQFRKVTFNEDKLEATHFVSLPHISYISAFKSTKETIHLLQDPEQYTLFERGIRGGLTFTNKHLITSGPGTILAYIDENNLYGNSLRQYLPHSNFEWCDEAEIQYFSDKDNILNIKDDNETGYLFEVDLNYPANIHDFTADYPLLPESGEITFDQFSPFMKDYYKLLHGTDRKYTPTRKLLLTQYNKEAYIVHYSILKFYLSMGIELVRVRRAIKFTQKPYLKTYIDENSKRRQKSQNAFEKDFYKLKNNSLFGKTMEDVRKRIDYKLKMTQHSVMKAIRSPLFHDRDIISDNLVGIHMLKPSVTLNKPIYIGQAVLEYSKLEMYQLYYCTLKPTPLIRQLRLVGGDTDSFFLEINVDDHQITRDDIFKEWSNKLDSSNYDKNHALYSIQNMAVLERFKDEAAGKEIEEMVLLRPKMYSIKYKNSSINRGVKKAKGVQKAVVQNFTHDDYKAAYRNKDCSVVNMTLIRAQNHVISTQTIRKKALSAWDEKRCWLTQNSSLPFGNYQL